MAEAFVQLAGSNHPAPQNMEDMGRVAGDEAITISLYLKRQSQASAEGYDVISRDALRQHRSEAHAEDFAAIEAFAAAHDLQIVEQDAGRRLVQLRGSAQALEQAFATELHLYKAADGAICRGRAGSLSIPADLGSRVTAVLGLDTSPIATPKIVPHRGKTPPAGFLPNEVGRLYGLPATSVSDQCIGIIELGGGYTNGDNQAAFAAMRLDPPDIIAIGVDDAANAPSGSDADGEVALDIQVAGGIAPGARLAVYFAPNTSQGFADAISQAVHDTTNKPSVISISWGSPESGWSHQAISAMHQTFEDAAELGVSLFAASGDALATDGASDGKAHVDYPASDPLVVGCGGTRIDASGDAITGEVVWKSNGGGTGGGVSRLFAKPAYQARVDVPHAPTKAGGRGVPDVAGDADPDSGYRIVVGGKVGIIGGTSAVAPLWAGIAARLNASRKTPLGAPHAFFYGAPEAFRDITEGNNKSGRIGYTAKAGWDPCTGLGSPDGEKLIDAAKRA